MGVFYSTMIRHLLGSLEMKKLHVPWVVRKLIPDLRRR
jgi:hypothetical protein